MLFNEDRAYLKRAVERSFLTCAQTALLCALFGCAPRPPVEPSGFLGDYSGFERASDAGRSPCATPTRLRRSRAWTCCACARRARGWSEGGDLWLGR